MFKADLVVTYNRIPEVMKRLRQIRDQAVQVGWFAEQGTHSAEGTSLSYAQLAAINHYGSAIRNIPPRPVLSVALYGEQITNFGEVKKGLQKVFSNVKSNQSASQTQMYLGTIGEEIAAKAKQLFGIVSASLPSNKASTIRKKGKNAPLVNTGALRDALMVKVERDNG